MLNRVFNIDDLQIINAYNNLSFKFKDKEDLRVVRIKSRNFVFIVG